jgi:hypothetical protein
MSVLPSGQPLARYFPDLDDFLYDPAGYLGAAPVTIGPRKMYGLAALFGLPGAACLLWCVARGEWDGEVLVMGIGLLLGAAVWLGWSLMMRGHELVLHPEGVEFYYRDTSVWCPWALFNAEGEPFVPDTDSPRAGLTLPVAAEAVPFVELRRSGAPVAFGAQVRARQFQFTAPDEVMLPARYEVAAADLGQLLLRLGSRLGRQLPKAAPMPEAYRAPAAPDGVPGVPDAAGWLTAYLTQLRFPAVCCDCGAETTATLAVPVTARGDWLLGLAAQPVRTLDLRVPVCEACQLALRQRQQLGGLRGLLLGAAGAMLAAIPLARSNRPDDARSLILVVLAAVSAGGLAGFLLGVSVARRLPVQVRGYSPVRGTLSIRFRQPGYVELVCEAMRSGQKTSGT